MAHYKVKIETGNTLQTKNFHDVMAALDFIRNESLSIDSGRAYLNEDGTREQGFIIQDGLATLWS